MRDAIGGLIGRYDQLGRYLDRSAIDGSKRIWIIHRCGSVPLN